MDKLYFVNCMVCLYVCTCFMALIIILVLCVRSQDLVMSVSLRRVHVVSRLLHLTAEESRAVRHVINMKKLSLLLTFVHKSV